MAANIEALHQQQYQELGALVATAPQLGTFPLPPETLAWLARASVLVDAVSGPLEFAGFTTACDFLPVAATRFQSANQIIMIVHRALARAEARAPAAAQGAFIPVGAQFTALQVIGQVLRTAKRHITIVDPFLNDVALFDFLPLAPERVTVRLLASNREQLSATLRTGAVRWRNQYGDTRPLEIRVAEQRLLHDRLIEIDGTSAYTLTQSLKDLANRSPATAVRVPQEIADPKIEAYNAIWADATEI